MTMGPGPTLQGTSRTASAVKDFQNARMQASLQEIASIFTGRSVALLSFDEVAEKLKMQGQIHRGRQTIPIASIVGSVGRYNDFTRTFLPRMANDEGRWAGVRAAAHHVADLPPIEVYQIGEAYFVIDGNHRVSIARRDGIEFIDATVVEVRTRVDLDPADDPYNIIIKAEYAQFLEETALDKTRPHSSLLLSVPGQYGQLYHHIEAHRYCMQDTLKEEIDFMTAAAAWYDEVYIPIVASIREQAILRHFPGRTETDFYIWIAENQNALQEELGWDIRAEVAVTQLAARFKPPEESRVAKLRRRVLKAVPGIKSGPKEQVWSQSKILARYSDRLFADILMPLTRARQIELLPRLLPLVNAEDSQLFGLHLPGMDEHDDWAVEFERHCREAGVKGSLAQETRAPVTGICERARLADLIVVSHHFPGLADEPTPSPMLISLLQESRRPVLILGDRPVGVGRSLLVYENSAPGQEVLFIAAYLMEKHGCSLTILTSDADDRNGANALQYLAMHEVEAKVFNRPGLNAGTIMAMAQEQEVDLIILPGISRRRLGRDSGTALVEALLAEGHHLAHDRSVLVGP